MISEITFSKKFTSFWNQTLPNANNFVRIVNLGLKDVIEDPFPEPRRPNNTALVNVISNRLFESFVSKKIKLGSINDPKFILSNEYNELYGESTDYLSRFAYGSNLSLPLTIDEMKESVGIFNVMYRKYGQYTNNIQLAPKFIGCGFINNSVGDMIIGETLIEIKSGQRHFSVVDFRQIITYCALNFSSGSKRKITGIEIFNPRMGISYSTSVYNLCRDLSAKSSNELFEEIKRYIVDTEFSFDNFNEMTTTYPTVKNTL